MFRGTASYYARFRPGYPPELLDQLADAAGLDGTGRLLDLGCGPGTIAIPLAPRVAEVIAVDNDIEMLEELSRFAPPNVVAVEAAAEDVGGRFGTFRLVTIGRAIHWFDGGRVLEQLRSVTSAVALLGDSLDDSEAMSAVLQIARELLGDRPPMRAPGIRYEQALAASPFSDVCELRVVAERTWTVDELIGFAYSTSFASPERVGDRREEFEATLRARLRPEYRERLPVSAVLGRRAT
ncbi:MAG TPA: class I SAM-dependent methyltransferase [Gaiellaceae bacterium]|nr:class I SAM-dependent methyltransferase [Gaiellaceae bacterium]